MAHCDPPLIEPDELVLGVGVGVAEVVLAMEYVAAGVVEEGAG
jgi:hypothetical protein